MVANHDVDITIRPATVHALIGENGAGKSTLMKILYGVQKPDEGTIKVDGEEVQFSSPTDAIKVGIGMVFQHFMLADNLTVLENVVLGAEKLHGIGDKARAEIVRISDAYGFGLDPDELVEDLGVGDRQRVEILKVLYRGAQIIILDEPTAVLVPQEVDALFDNLRELRGRRPHHPVHLPQARRGARDRRRHHGDAARHHGRRGRPEDGHQARQLAELMVGSELPSPETEESTVTDEVLLELTGVDLVDDRGRHLLRDIGLTIHRGEVLGIAGVEGNGQAELVETIMGMRKAHRPDHARGPRHLRVGHPRSARGRDRLHPRGPAPPWPAARRAAVGEPDPRPPDPSALERQRLSSTAPAPARTPSASSASTTCARRRIDTHARALSGGNQQKLIVGREMSGDPVLLIAAHPTRGVDVGAQAAIWEHIKRARREGLGGAADLCRPRRADRPLRPDRGDPARRAGRRVRPAGRHPAGPRRRDDRREGVGMISVRSIALRRCWRR